MSHWAFITASYLIVLVGSALLAAWAWRAMRKAEQAAESLRKRP